MKLHTADYCDRTVKTHRGGLRGYRDGGEENGNSLWAQRGFSLREEMIVIKVQGRRSFQCLCLPTDHS